MHHANGSKSALPGRLIASVVGHGIRPGGGTMSKESANACLQDTCQDEPQHRVVSGARISS
jgi:hypothetical protein